MGAVRNILFIMLDQIRWDYLSCAGHPTLETPNIDALAVRGVRFTRAYCNSSICTPSRMSFLTGRSLQSHGCTWNNFPLDVAEMTLGDYLRPLGLRTAIVGKIHHNPDRAGMARLGIDPAGPQGSLLLHCGFEPFEHDDGLWPDKKVPADLAYNLYLRSKGMDGANPWHEWANAAAGPNGEVLSGWQMRHANLPARVPEEHSETAYMTDRAISFIDEAGDQPWCLHLSYIKPHWPYMAPAPYHALYGPDAILPHNADPAERTDPHPVYAAFMQHPEGQSFSREECRRTVIPTYMGLIRQVDDHIGRLMAFLGAHGRLDDTMIVFTSDHGDYLGDHWLGEKELFHDESIRIPLIVVDPSADADETRGSTDDRLVESIDLLPTFIEAVGGKTSEGEAEARLEGHSLLGVLRGHSPTHRRGLLVNELDYGPRQAARTLGVRPRDARATMAFDGRYKFVDWQGFPPQLFDTLNDPRERVDLGRDPGHEAIRKELAERLAHWRATRKSRVTIDDARIMARPSSRSQGYLIGEW